MIISAAERAFLNPREDLMQVLERLARVSIDLFETTRRLALLNGLELLAVEETLALKHF